MKLKVAILIFTIFLASGEYLAGQANRVPRVKAKDFLALEMSGKVMIQYWIEDKSNEKLLDFNEQYDSNNKLHIQGTLLKHVLHTVSFSISVLDPMLLDRPPPNVRLSFAG